MALNWQTQLLQTVIFTGPKQPYHEAKTIYTAAVGAEPETYGGQGPASFAGGTQQGLRLTVSTQPLRIDLSLNAIDPPENMIGQPPAIEDAAAATAILTALSQTVVAAVVPVRMGAHRHVFASLPDEDAGAVQMNELFGKPLFSEGDRELIYQVNRRRNSAVDPTLLLNCVGRWQAQVRNVMLFHVGNTVETALQGQPAPVLALTIDVNTKPREEPLVNVGGIMLELIDIAADLATRGPDAF